MQWKSGHVSELQVTSDAMILKSAASPKLFSQPRERGRPAELKMPLALFV